MTPERQRPETCHSACPPQPAPAAVAWSFRRLAVHLAVVLAASGLAGPAGAAEDPGVPPEEDETATTATAAEEKTEAQLRAEALERLARGGDGLEPMPIDDSPPRNREARLVSYEPPKYPKELAGTGVSAEITLSVLIDRNGRASHVRVEDSSDPLFTNAALDAVNQWGFLPRIREGRVSNARMRLTVLVSEEVGDQEVHDFTGGRIALESIKYAQEPDTKLRRYFGLRPAYPFRMLADRKAGEVIIECTVADDGLPYDIKVVEATNRDFAYACQGALVHWQFSPAEKVGRVVPARLRYRMSFQPEEFDESVLKLAEELKAGRTGGLETARTITQQARVERSHNPSSYDGTNSAPRRRRVTVEVVVTAEGEVMLPRVVSAPDPLSGYIALAAVNYWRFEPARKNDVPVAALLSFPVTF